MNEKKIILTGIKPTGYVHIGNYFGAIVPAIKYADKYSARYFIADYHALNMIQDAEKLREFSYNVAATWLACGLDPDKCLFYKQSDIPETFELATILSAFTPKGLMNRAHAYKAKVEENLSLSADNDSGVNMGLFTYPVLMAADILLFDSDIVPVGKDQVQHLEMAVDIAQYINRNYKTELFKIPEPMLQEETRCITGLDGRKMSKSYDNGIALFLDEKELRNKIMKIKTNSQPVDDPKDPDTCTVFSLFKLFSSKEEQAELREKYVKGGMGWGYAKERLFEAMNSYLPSMREKYEYYMSNKKIMADHLRHGAEKARQIAAEKMAFVREIIGIN